MGDMCDVHTQAEHDSAVAATVTAATETNPPTGEHAHAMSTAAITSMRGGRPTAAVVPPIGTNSGAAKSAAEGENPKPPANPLNVVVGKY